MYTAITSESEIYPGMFHPASGIEEQVEKANRGIRSPMHFRAQLTESDNIYILRLYTGNLEKENLIVYTTPSYLLIYGRKHPNKLPGFELDKYMIELPSDADTNFVTTEFRKGLLTLYLTKKGKHMQNYPGRLILY